MTENPSTERDRGGRFLPGNTTSRKGGNPRLKHMAELQEAARSAVTPDQLRELLARMHGLAMAGDVAAARLLVERIAGTPVAAEPPIDLDFDGIDLGSADGIGQALQRIVHGAAAGAVPLVSAERLGALLGRVADATVLRQLEQRLDELDAGGAA